MDDIGNSPGQQFIRLEAKHSGVLRGRPTELAEFRCRGGDALPLFPGGLTEWGRS